VAVGEDYGCNVCRIKTNKLNVCKCLFKTDPCPAIDKDEFAKIDEIYAAIAYIG
jgi:hypothetical protein